MFVIKPLRGTDHANAKLDDRKVQIIRKWAKRGVKQYVLARRLGVSQSTVNGVIRRTRWSHVQ